MNINKVKNIVVGWRPWCRQSHWLISIIGSFVLFCLISVVAASCAAQLSTNEKLPQITSFEGNPSAINQDGSLQYIYTVRNAKHIKITEAKETIEEKDILSPSESVGKEGYPGPYSGITSGKPPDINQTDAGGIVTVEAVLVASNDYGTVQQAITLSNYSLRTSVSSYGWFPYLNIFADQPCPTGCACLAEPGFGFPRCGTGNCNSPWFSSTIKHCYRIPVTPCPYNSGCSCMTPAQAGPDLQRCLSDRCGYNPDKYCYKCPVGCTCYTPNQAPPGYIKCSDTKCSTSPDKYCYKPACPGQSGICNCLSPADVASCNWPQCTSQYPCDPSDPTKKCYRCPGGQSCMTPTDAEIFYNYDSSEPSDCKCSPPGEPDKYCYHLIGTACTCGNCSTTEYMANNCTGNNTMYQCSSDYCGPNPYPGIYSYCYSCPSGCQCFQDGAVPSGYTQACTSGDCHCKESGPPYWHCWAKPGEQPTPCTCGACYEDAFALECGLTRCDNATNSCGPSPTQHCYYNTECPTDCHCLTESDAQLQGYDITQRCRDCPCESIIGQPPKYCYKVKSVASCEESACGTCMDDSVVAGNPNYILCPGTPACAPLNQGSKHCYTFQCPDGCVCMTQAVAGEGFIRCNGFGGCSGTRNYCYRCPEGCECIADNDPILTDYDSCSVQIASANQCGSTPDDQPKHCYRPTKSRIPADPCQSWNQSTVTWTGSSPGSWTGPCGVTAPVKIESINSGSAVQISSIVACNPLDLQRAYTWSITSSSGATMASGSGPTATFIPESPGSYTATFSASCDGAACQSTCNIPIQIDSVTPKTTGGGSGIPFSCSCGSWSPLTVSWPGGSQDVLCTPAAVVPSVTIPSLPPGTAVQISSGVACAPGIFNIFTGEKCPANETWTVTSMFSGQGPWSGSGSNASFVPTSEGSFIVSFSASCGSAACTTPCKINIGVKSIEQSQDGLPTSGAPVIVSFTPSPTQVSPKEPVKLNWIIKGEGVATLECNGEKSTVPFTGSTTITPAQSGCCTLTASNKYGDDQKTACVTILTTKEAPAHINSFTASSTQVYAGGRVGLNWSISGTGEAYLTCGGQRRQVPFTGSSIISPSQSGCCTLAASNKSGSDQKSACITVMPPKITPPTVTPPAVTPPIETPPRETRPR